MGKTRSYEFRNKGTLYSNPRLDISIDQMVALKMKKAEITIKERDSIIDGEKITISFESSSNDKNELNPFWFSLKDENEKPVRFRKTSKK